MVHENEKQAHPRWQIRANVGNVGVDPHRNFF